MRDREREREREKQTEIDRDDRFRATEEGSIIQANNFPIIAKRSHAHDTYEITELDNLESDRADRTGASELAALWPIPSPRL